MIENITDSIFDKVLNTINKKNYIKKIIFEEYEKKFFYYFIILFTFYILNLLVLFYTIHILRYIKK